MEVISRFKVTQSNAEKKAPQVSPRWQSYSQTGMVMEDLEPATEYMIRLSSINKYGTSDGVLLTQNTREGIL